MAEIILNVEVRERTGTGSARAARREGKVPGVLYGGALGPVPIAVSLNAFRKSLYTGKLIGHLVTLKHGDETQPVIAKDIQFDPVTDTPVHFDLYRVDAHQDVKISIPVHFMNQDVCPGLKRGGTLNIAFHELEVLVAADHIPEEIVVDLKGLNLGDAIHVSDLKLAQGVRPTAEGSVVLATVAQTSALASEDAAADAAVAAEQHAESEIAATEAAIQADAEAAAADVG